MQFFIVTAAYVFCYALTVFIVTPLQSMVLPDVTAFASLVFFPHGVRVLATWAFGWRAIPGLLVGAVICTLLLTPADYAELLRPAVLEAIFLGSVVAFGAFEVARLAGYDFYWRPANRLNWKGLIVIGAVASIANSVGSTLIYAGLIGVNQLDDVLLIYAAGDLIGLIACMLLLMLGFRWARLIGTAKKQ